MPVEASVDFMQEAFGQVASEPFVAEGYVIFVGPPGEVAGDGEPLGTQDIVEAIGAAARGVGALLQVQLPSLLHTTVRTALWFGERC